MSNKTIFLMGVARIVVITYLQAAESISPLSNSASGVRLSICGGEGRLIFRFLFDEDDGPSLAK